MATSHTKKSVNRRERIGGAVYILAFFITGVAVSVWLLLSGLDLSRAFSRKDAIEMKMRRQQSFNTSQEETAAMCDLLVQKIEGYDPGINAIYEKNDIRYVINELHRKYEDNTGDKRHLVFLHLADFYQMWFNDKEHLWNIEANLGYFKDNLAECELGLEKKKEELKSN